MKMLAKILITFLLVLSANFVWGAGGSNHAKGIFGAVDIDLGNKASLQRGAKYFVNYCLSCHSAQHSRYKRVADDLGISENLMLRNMIFSEQKFGGLMTVAMRREDAKKWFLGIDPPDLSTHVRAIGSQAVYEFLKAFYIDEARPFGVNNAHLPNTAMPHVLADVQGLQVAVYDEAKNHGKGHGQIVKFEMLHPGTASVDEYEQIVVDIVNFLAYLSEPAQLVRYKIGVGVLFFLALLGVLSFFLKRHYWKDVH